jgi:hypothetical protein
MTKRLKLPEARDQVGEPERLEEREVTDGHKITPIRNIFGDRTAEDP